jgi:hypothetical protein
MSDQVAATLTTLLQLRDNMSVAMLRAQKAAEETQTTLLRLEKQAGSTGKAFDGLGGAAFVFNNVRDAAATVVGVITSVADAALDLAERGGKVSNVSAAFEQLAGSAANANAILQAGREGTKGLISDYDLMVAANKMLNLGLPTTDANFRTLTEGATKLGAAVGRDAADSMNRLIEGLGKGSAEMLDELGLVVRAEQAYKQYAASLGTTADALTAKQRQLAIYEEGLRQVEEKVAKLADRQLTFSDRLRQSRTAVKNFTDALGMAIARSPVLNELMGSIATSLQQAFGKNQQEAVASLIRIINDLAIGAVSLAKVGVQAAAFISNAFNGLKAVFAAVLTGMADSVVKVLGLLESVAQAGAKIPGMVGTSFKAMAQDIGGVADHVALVRAQMGEYGGSIVDTIGNTKQAETAALGWLDKMEAALLAARDKVITTGNAFTGPGGPAEGAAAAAASVEELLKAQNVLADFTQQMIPVYAEFLGMSQEQLQALLGHRDALEAVGLTADEVAQQYTDLQNALAQATDEMIGVQATLMGISETALRALLGQRPAIDDNTGSTIKWKDELDKVVGQVDGIADALRSLGIEGDSTLGRMIQGFQDLAHAAQDGAEAYLKFSSGDVVGGITSGIKAIGGLVSGFKNLFGDGGAAKRMREELAAAAREADKLRQEFIAGAGGLTELHQKAQRAGVTLQAMFDARNADALKAAIEGIEDALDFQAEAQEKLNEALEEYGFTWEEMGATVQGLRLDEMASKLYEQYQVLNAAGVDHNAILERMGPNFSEYVNKALSAGQAIPEAMRPIIEKLIASGDLVDENGEAYTSAEDAGIKWTESLGEGLSKTLDAVNRLVAAIERLAGIHVPPINVPVNYDDGGGPRPHHGLPKEYEAGGLAKGPSSGYAATLHGNEFVVPQQATYLRQLGQEIVAAMGAVRPSAHAGEPGMTVNAFIGSQPLGRAAATAARRREGGRAR